MTVSSGDPHFDADRAEQLGAEEDQRIDGGAAATPGMVGRAVGHYKNAEGKKHIVK